MITNNDLFFIRMAANISKNLTHVLRSKHAAILVDRRKIVSIGVNKTKTDPLQREYARKPNLSYIHAEIDCFKNVLPKSMNHVTLYVVRTDEKHHWRESCPCEGCERAIRKFNIHRVIHTINSGIVEKFYD